jgi:hypothetical protein
MEDDFEKLRRAYLRDGNYLGLFQIFSSRGEDVFWFSLYPTVHCLPGRAIDR